MKIFTFSISVLFILSTAVISQVHQEWVQRLNGPGNSDDYVKAMVIDGSGNIYVTGSSFAEGTGRNYATIKYNSSGVQQWLSIYNGPASGVDEAFAIAVDGSGNVYVTGYSMGNGSYYDYATIKYNSGGIQVWTQRYNGTGNASDMAESIAVDGSGNVYVTGQSYTTATNCDYVTIKYNTSGVQQWLQKFNGSGDQFDGAIAIKLDASANVYVTGTSRGSGTATDYVTVKYNSSGVQQWYASYNGPANSNEYAYALAVDGAGNAYVTGYSSPGGSNFDIATVKYNTSGVMQWAQRYNGTADSLDGGQSIAVDNSGNVYVCGESINTGTGDDCITIKYNSTGTQQWVRTYNGTGNSPDFALSSAIDGAGSIYVTGSCTGNGTSSDCLTVKYNPSGVQQWVAIYNGPVSADDNSRCVAIDGSGNVYVAGSSTGNGTSFDFCTIKYSQQIGIKKISSEIPDKYFLSQNYPNPFNPSTNIEFNIPKTSYIELIVYDLLGREIETLVNEELKAGSYSVDFNADRLSSGVYYYKLIYLDYAETKKMVIVK